MSTVHQVFRTSPLLRKSRGVVLLLCAIAVPANADQEDVEREFSLKVLPLLKSKCFACHGDDPEKIKGGLNLRTREGMLRGGEESDQVLVPGHANDSNLFVAVTWENSDLEMPPKENDRLNSEQIEQLRRWIDAGAPWPDEATQEKYRVAERAQKVTADGVLMATSGGLGDEWTYRRYPLEDVWAFQPVTKPESLGGVLTDQASGEHAIDAFVDAKRNAAGFEPAPLADPAVLTRRIFFDLVGLPPTPEQLGQWVPRLAESEATVAELVDVLLASPEYGERWGQHWLDIARYADTGGYSNDYERSNAWRYRDYVIRSLNEDKPYDQFIIEQIAGDELADASVLERSGGDEKAVVTARKKGNYTAQESEWIVASGFLRMGAWDNAMVKAPGGASNLSRRRSQFGRANFPCDDDALLQVPRSQVRPVANPRLLPALLRFCRNADGGKACADPGRRELRGL